MMMSTQKILRCSNILKADISHTWMRWEAKRNWGRRFKKIFQLHPDYRHPSKIDYQQKGNLPLLIVPISQMYFNRNVNPEIIPLTGLSWLKACFTEYYKQDIPLFHICLHSPFKADEYFISAMDDFLRFISGHNAINFKFASEIKEYNQVSPKTKILPYILAINRRLTGSFSKKKASIFGETK
ncbi:hypothetical protein MBGDN05_00221 [Thermoplasmatales archaeon SCGC AB-539-N05]|nr:hypothetical protein MBGDN05_00221 [Thermoplasmatales archaeon SCGC AB-539-N05]